MTFQLSPAGGRGFAVKTGEDEILRVTGGMVTPKGPRAINGLDRVIARLKAMIGIEPPKSPAKHSIAQPVLLLLYENPSDLPALRKLSQHVSGRDVMFKPALEAASEPDFVRRLGRAIQNGRIDECMVIAGSHERQSPDVSDLYEAVRRVAEGCKPIRQVRLLPNGRLGVTQLRKPESRLQGNDAQSEMQEAEDHVLIDLGPDPGG